LAPTFRKKSAQIAKQLERVANPTAARETQIKTPVLHHPGAQRLEKLKSLSVARALGTDTGTGRANEFSLHGDKTAASVSDFHI
jgi:hypothetical protein